MDVIVYKCFFTNRFEWLSMVDTIIKLMQIMMILRQSVVVPFQPGDHQLRHWWGRN